MFLQLKSKRDLTLSKIESIHLSHLLHLRPGLKEDQAGMKYAIPPFWMKFYQTEGNIQQLSKTKWTIVL